MNKYFEKAQNYYTVDLLHKVWEDLDSGVIPGKESAFYNEVKLRKDSNPFPLILNNISFLDFSEIINELPD